MQAGVKYGGSWPAVREGYGGHHGNAAGAADAADIGGEDVKKKEGIANNPCILCARVSRDWRRIGRHAYLEQNRRMNAFGTL